MIITTEIMDRLAHHERCGGFRDDFIDFFFAYFRSLKDYDESYSKFLAVDLWMFYKKRERNLIMLYQEFIMDKDINNAIVAYINSTNVKG